MRGTSVAKDEYCDRAAAQARDRGAALSPYSVTRSRPVAFRPYSASRPARTFNNVVLPEPLGPTMAVNVAGATAPWRPRTSRLGSPPRQEIASMAISRNWMPTRLAGSSSGCVPSSSAAGGAPLHASSSTKRGTGRCEVQSGRSRSGDASRRIGDSSRPDVSRGSDRSETEEPSDRRRELSASDFELTRWMRRRRASVGSGAAGAATSPQPRAPAATSTSASTAGTSKNTTPYAARPGRVASRSRPKGGDVASQ